MIDLDSSILNDRIAALVGVDPMNLVAAIADASREAGVAQARYERLSEERKIILAEESLSAEKRLKAEKQADKSIRITDSILDAEARASARFARHVEEMERAYAERTQAEARMWEMRNMLDVVLEQIRYARQEMRLTGEAQ